MWLVGWYVAAGSLPRISRVLPRRATLPCRRGYFLPAAASLPATNSACPAPTECCCHAAARCRQPAPASLPPRAACPHKPVCMPARTECFLAAASGNIVHETYACGPKRTDELILLETCSSHARSLVSYIYWSDSSVTDGHERACKKISDNGNHRLSRDTSTQGRIAVCGGTMLLS